MRFSVNQTSVPAFNVVTLSECKDFLEISSDDDNHDAKINNLILGATARAENYTKKLFAQRTAVIYADYFQQYIKLPINPIISLDAIKYYDADDAQQTMPTSDYDVDIYATPPLIRITQFPVVRDKLNAVQFEVTAGYATVDNVPAAIKEAIKFNVYQSFLNRGTENDEIVNAFKNTLYPYRNEQL